MSSNQALEQLRRREAQALARIHRTGDQLMAHVLGEPGQKQADRPLGSALIPIGLAAGVGYLLAPRRPRAGETSGAHRMASAGWLLVASRAAGALSHLGIARPTGNLSTNDRP